MLSKYSLQLSQKLFVIPQETSTSINELKPERERHLPCFFASISFIDFVTLLTKFSFISRTTNHHAFGLRLVVVSHSFCLLSVTAGSESRLELKLTKFISGTPNNLAFFTLVRYSLILFLSSFSYSWVQAQARAQTYYFALRFVVVSNIVLSFLQLELSPSLSSNFKPGLDLMLEVNNTIDLNLNLYRIFSHYLLNMIDGLGSKPCFLIPHCSSKHIETQFSIFMKKCIQI